MKLIDIDKVEEILRNLWKEDDGHNSEHRICYNKALQEVQCEIDTLEQVEVDLYNNGWIDCAKQMPQETKQTSDTLQGHREWTESDMVLVWDSMYGCGIDSTRNGKWRREQRGGYTGQVVHGIIAWRPIPEFREDLL